MNTTILLMNALELASNLAARLAETERENETHGITIEQLATKITNTEENTNYWIALAERRAGTIRELQEKIEHLKLSLTEAYDMKPGQYASVLLGQMIDDLKSPEIHAQHKCKCGEPFCKNTFRIAGDGEWQIISPQNTMFFMPPPNWRIVITEEEQQ